VAARPAGRGRAALSASAYGGTWSASDPGIYPSDQSRHPGPIVGGVWGDLEDEYAEHIARWDPARVLAEVNAKRRILDEAVRLMSYDGEFQFLELLALPYADRPGYREEWRP
jgi:hypothetical protein